MFEAAERTRKVAEYQVSPQGITGCRHAAAVESGSCPHMTKVRCERIQAEPIPVTLADCQKCVLKEGI